MSQPDFLATYGPAALVTGASSGIGRSFAQLLAAAGFDLLLVARRRERLDALAAQLQAQHSVRVTVWPIDLADPAAPQRIAAGAAGVDIGLLVSNAGFGLKGEHAANDPRALGDMLLVNCNAPMMLARGFIPRLRARGKGGIIFTSSVEGLIGCPYSSAYAATKAFVNSLAEGLWGELTPQGIDVLSLCPGATDTEAAALQGIDPATLHHLMPPADVAEFALRNLKNGPVVISSEHYRGVFAGLLSMPRREALAAMARSMKK